MTKRTQVDWIDQLPEWTQEEVRYERACGAKIKRRAALLADAVADYPHSWDWGDGFGGSVLQDVYEALEARGFSRFPPPKPDDGKPKRKPMNQITRTRIYERDAYACLHCGVRKNLQVDHVIPVSAGGTDEDDNLQTLCASCNASKGARI